MITVSQKYPVLHKWKSLAKNFWACMLIGVAMSPMVQAGAEESLGFDSPEAGIAALVGAIQQDDTSQLETILGPFSHDLINSGDTVADQQRRQVFLGAYQEAHAIVPISETRAELIVGKDEWPMPIPLVHAGNQWRFDTQEGAQEILLRRIVRNELAAMQVCLAIVEAQYEYAALDPDGDGLLEYAQKFVSSPESHDGLFWETANGEPLSPLGPLLASATQEGYADSHSRPLAPYHGYFYKLLSNQGPDASGGPYDFVVRDHMIGGFGLVAYPAHYGVSGIMSFIVNHDGVLYQKDLGQETETLASAMSTYNPDSTWSSVPAPSTLAP